MDIDEIQEKTEEIKSVLNDMIKDYMQKEPNDITAKRFAFELDALLTEYDIRCNFDVVLHKERKMLMIAPIELKSYLIFNSLVNK